jgi:hypothetical protein
LEDTGRARVLLGGVPGGAAAVFVEVETVDVGGEVELEVGGGRTMGVEGSFLLRRKRWMCFSMVAWFWCR